MKTLQQLLRLEKLHKFIREEHTGTPQQVAEKLAISRSTLYEMLTYLKDVGATVEYSRNRRTFYYAKKFHLKVEVIVTVLKNEEAEKIIGGTYLSQRISIELE